MQRDGEGREKFFPQKTEPKLIDKRKKTFFNKWGWGGVESLCSVGGKTVKNIFA